MRFSLQRIWLEILTLIIFGVIRCLSNLFVIGFSFAHLLHQVISIMIKVDSVEKVLFCHCISKMGVSGMVRLGFTGFLFPWFLLFKDHICAEPVKQCLMQNISHTYSYLLSF